VYGKIFESIYDGSLYGQWEAIVTMQQLIVLADADGIIDMTPPAIAGKTSIPLDILEKGLKILSQPDPYSRSPGSNGARIELLDEQRPWGWFLVNHIKYRDMHLRDHAQPQRPITEDYLQSMIDPTWADLSASLDNYENLCTQLGVSPQISV